jgi:hypothetical protein
MPAVHGADARMKPRAAYLTGIFILLLWLPPLGATAQEGNLDRLEACARALCDSLLDAYPDKEPLCVDIVRHPASWMLEQAMLQSAAAHGIPVTTCDSSSSEALTLAVTAIGMEYHEIDAEDSLARDARIEASAIMPARKFRMPQHGNGTVESGPVGRTSASYAIVRRDTVGADQTPLLEASGYDYARGTLPPRSGGGVWKKIVEPAVVLGAAVVMAILLFTVRSQ